MSNTITFEDARQAGIILPGHYIAITAPKDRQVTVTKKETGVKGKQKFTVKSGERQPWRVTEDFKLWGNPTKEKLTLYGLVGFEKGSDTMHRVINELYEVPDFFDKACSLSKKDYLKKAYQEGEEYDNPEDKWMWHWLASCCLGIGCRYAGFHIARVDTGEVSAAYLYTSEGYMWNHTYAIRSEATPTATLLLERDGCDGSKEKPWKCLSK